MQLIRVVLLLHILLIAKFAYGLDASSECLTAHQFCIENAASQKRNILNGPTDKQLEASLNQCFTKDGCDEPEPDPKVELNENKRKEKAKIVQCQNKTVMARLPAIEKCVQQTVTDFKLRQPLKIANGSKTDPLVNRRHFLEQTKKQCKGDNGKIDNVKKCIASTFYSASASQKSKTDRQKMTEFCDARQACQSKLSVECKKELEQLKAAVCQCEKQQDNREIETLYQTCLNGEQVSTDGKAKNKQLSHTQMKQINTAFCSTDEDVCDQPKQMKLDQLERQKQNKRRLDGERRERNRQPNATKRT